MTPLFVRFVLLAACVMAWPAQALLRTAAELQPAATPAPVALSRKVVAPASVRLPEPSPNETMRAGAEGQRAQIGFARTVPGLRTSSDVARTLAWTASDAQRQAAAVAITSPGASALRVALRMGAVPRGTRFRFASANGAVVEIEAADVEATIARNVYYGEDSPGAHLFWSPVLEGDTAIVEIDVPASAERRDLHIALPLVSHLVTSASQGFAAACGAAACDDAAGPVDGIASARIVFTEEGATYACNGMLVADRDPETTIPFFLTSRHCISTQAAASSAQPYWPRAGSPCASGAPLEPGSEGATLLHADVSADLTLIRLQRAPPAGAAYAGWIVGAQRSASAGADAKDLVKAGYVAAPGDGARAVVSALGQCPATSGTSSRFEAAYNAGLYQWLGGTPQDAAEEEAAATTPGS